MFTTTLEFPGVEFIMYDNEPFRTFRAYKFENAEALEAFVKKYNLLNDCVLMENFYILLSYMGPFQKLSSVPVLGHNVPPPAKELFNELKAFYEQSRIKGNETRFKKFRR